MNTRKLNPILVTICAVAISINGKAQINNGTNTLSGNSSSTGTGNTGNGSYSFSTGTNNTTTGSNSVALGYGNSVSGAYSIAGVRDAQATGVYSFALGMQAKSLNHFSAALGAYSEATGHSTYSFGKYIKSSASNSYTIGMGASASQKLENNIANSIMLGINSNLPTLFIEGSSGTGTTGNVGIGTTMPADKMQVNTNMSRLVFGGLPYPSSLNWSMSYMGFNASRNTSGTWLSEGNGANNGGAIIFSNVGGDLYFSNIPNSGSTNQVYSDADVLNNRSMTITANGVVTVGNSTPNPTTKFSVLASNPNDYAVFIQNGAGQGRGLLIKGGVSGSAQPEFGLLRVQNYNGDDIFMVEGATQQVRAREILVNLNSWPDYVFSEEYELKPLTEVEKFIKENNHLPNVPAEKEIVEGGVNLGKMDAILLQKIEELTLYVIEQEKRINEQTKLINQLSKNK